jgi:pimeloyl-ACP methyl ester carboxylesterase
MPRVESAGVNTHYEDRGTGEPVVLLHGGLESGASWAPYAARWSTRYRVLVPDRRGHGRTPDVDGPYTYEAMADETAAFLDRVAGSPARLVGYSDGGIVSLLVARERPDLVRSVVAIGTNHHIDGLAPQFLARLSQPDPHAAALAPLRDAYQKTSPDGPEHWTTFHAKVSAMGSTGPTMSTDDIRAIACPVLVVVGDDDVVTIDHTVAFFHALRAGQLTIVPGTSHLLPYEKPELLMALVESFLSQPKASRLMPVRTAG